MGASVDRIVIPAASLLFAEGDRGEVAYLIKSGRVETFVVRDNRELMLGIRGPGEIVGEMAIIDHGTRSASARVLEDCELLVITGAQIAHRFGNTDPILRMCLGVVIDRYRETVAQLDHGNCKRFVEQRPTPPSDQFEAAIRTLSLESELRRALQRREFVLFFQPIVRFPKRRLAGFEALIRWHHPERGLVPPSEFIPIAEAGGLIVDITAWGLGEVCRVFPTLTEKALHNAEAVDRLTMSVNISGHDLAHAPFVPMIAALLADSGIAPSTINLEVTESVLMKDPAKAAAVLEACRAIGMNIAIDDFGTGYSSLSHLSALPITTLKIDQSFIRSMSVDATSRKIIQMTLRLADELEIPVVAEGIEHEHEAQSLCDQGCALGQGYLFGRPQPLEPTLALIASWTAQSAFRRDDSARPAQRVAL
jgi:EAL domain-containing protein (putative c-di-GMP-specific phosphodiesterase class I)